jgi:assimilatory nitrate reductase catalytic subunit
VRRIAVLDGEGRLTAALFLSRKGRLPSREWVAGQLGRTSATGLELLAGRPATPQANHGPIVCVCLGVGANEIAASACAGATSVAEIGAATGAGTNCGSCRPAIKRLLADIESEAKEAAA